MEPALSIIMPVHNAEASLAAQVGRLLDIVTDITSFFEVLIVDDGSTDDTSDVAYELARSYPQLRIMRQGEHVGTQAAVRQALLASRGNVIFVQEDPEIVSAEQIIQAWQMRQRDSLLMAREGLRPIHLRPGLLDRLHAWGTLVREECPRLVPRPSDRHLRTDTGYERRDHAGKSRRTVAAGVR